MAELLWVAIAAVNLIVAAVNLLNARGNRRQAAENLSMAQENRRNAAAIADRVTPAPAPMPLLVCKNASPCPDIPWCSRAGVCLNVPRAAGAMVAPRPPGCIRCERGPCVGVAAGCPNGSPGAHGFTPPPPAPPRPPSGLARGAPEYFSGRAVASWKKAAANMVAHWKANGPTVEAQWCTHAAQLLCMGSELMPDGVSVPGHETFPEQTP